MDILLSPSAQASHNRPLLNLSPQWAPEGLKRKGKQKAPPYRSQSTFISCYDEIEMVVAQKIVIFKDFKILVYVSNQSNILSTLL